MYIIFIFFLSLKPFKCKRAQFEKTPGRLPIAMTPIVTPARSSKVTAIDPLRDRLQEEDDSIIGEKQVSPGLKQLRQTPGK